MQSVIVNFFGWIVENLKHLMQVLRPLLAQRSIPLKSNLNVHLDIL